MDGEVFLALCFVPFVHHYLIVTTKRCIVQLPNVEVGRALHGMRGVQGTTIDSGDLEAAVDPNSGGEPTDQSSHLLMGVPLQATDPGI